MCTLLTSSFSVDPFIGFPSYKIKYLNDWCKRLNTAVESNDAHTLKELTESMHSPDDHLNPIRMAISLDYEYVIPGIVQALKDVAGLDASVIARLLTLSSCPIKNVISQHSVDVVEHMIRLGSPVNEAPDDRQNVWSSTALHSAVAGGDSHLPAVQLLLDHGADVHSLDSLGFTPLHRCLETRHSLQVLRLLVARGARADTHNVARTSALFTAIRNQQPLEVVKLLVQGGADVGARDSRGLAPLHHAAREVRRDLVDYLLDLGVDPNLRTLDGESLLTLAFARAPLDFLRHLVLVCGVELNARTRAGGYTLLHVVYSSPHFSLLATKRDYRAVADKLRFCLLRGADVNARCEDRAAATVLQQSLRHHDNWLDVLLEQVAIEEFMDRPVDGEIARLIQRSDFCASYLAACKLELVALMDARFYNDVTLFNVLTDGDARMMAYVRNRELLAAFRRVCDTELFLTYSPALNERIGHFSYLHKMQRTAVSVLARCLRDVASHVAVREIAKRLSVRDLYRLSRFHKEM